MSSRSRPRAGSVPRICLATDSLEPSGVGEHMLTLANAMPGFQLVLACPPGPGGRRLLDRAAALGFAIRALPDDGRAIAGWLTSQTFDLLHVHAGIGWEGHGLAAAGRAAGIPLIVRTEHLPDLITDPGQRRQHRDGVAMLDRMICVSEASLDSHVAAGVPRETLVAIRNGLVPRPPSRARDEIRQALGLTTDTPMILTVARLTEQKDHATLIAALPRILSQHPRLQVMLAGTGPTAQSLQDRVEDLGFGGTVHLLGARDDVPDLLAAADLFVLPSRFEGLPLAILEAMAAGLPVVATRIGGTEEAVEHQSTGVLVPPGDPGRLAEAVAALLTDREQARRIGEAGRRRFQQSFTAEHMAERTIDCYRALGLPDMTRRTALLMTGSQPRRTRIGFIGAGGIAHRHLGVLESFEDVELVAFADPALDRATEAAERFGARVFADHEAMLDAVDLDALYICVPPFAHGAPERSAIARKLPFFVEKPLAADPDTAEAIGRAVAEARLITGVGYHWRYLDTVEEARTLLSDNPARLVSGYWLDATPPPRWWWRQDRSGGQMVEQTTHVIDLARYLVGDVSQVFGLAGHTERGDFPGLDVATASTASLRFASGAIGNMSSTCLLRWGHRIALHIFGDGLAIELTDQDIMVDVGHGRPFRHAEGDPVWREDRDFIDAVRGDENRIRCPYGEALITHRITMAIQRSAASGQPVDLPSPIPHAALARAREIEHV